MNLQLKSKKLQIEKEIHEYEDKKSEKINFVLNKN